MQVGKIKSELLKERKALAAKIEAIDQTLAGIDQYQGLNGRALPADPVPVKAAKRVKAKRAQPVVPCPDCGKRYKAGPGLAAHRKAVHGWKVGYPLYDPLPREV